MNISRNASPELELKFELPPDDARDLGKLALLRGTKAKTQEQATVYFDTGKGAVAASGHSLRVRKVGAAYVQTIKTAANGAGLFHRQEWEDVVPGPAPDHLSLKDTPLEGVAADKLCPVIQSDVDRTIWTLTHSSSEIEIALDRGMIRANEGEAVISELELELKNGDPRDLFDLAGRLSQSRRLRIGVLSKEERGRALAGGTLGTVHKSPPLKFKDDLMIGEVFAAILLSCIRHFRLNEPLIVAERKVEALHQGRVAMRRLRAALSLFRPVVRRSTFRNLREDLRWFTAALGEARNLDVFEQNYGDSIEASDLERLREARNQAYAVAIAHIESQRFRDLLLGIVEWLETAPWQRSKAGSAIRPFAAERLQLLWEEVQSAAGRIDQLSDEDLHLLRIDIKKLRYGVGFLGSLYDRKAVKAFGETIGTLQDRLGEWNDQVVAAEVAAKFSLRLPVPQSGGDRNERLAPIRQLLATLERQGAFWRPEPDALQLTTTS